MMICTNSHIIHVHTHTFNHANNNYYVNNYVKWEGRAAHAHVRRGGWGWGSKFCKMSFLKIFVLFWVLASSVRGQTDCAELQDSDLGDTSAPPSTVGLLADTIGVGRWGSQQPFHPNPGNQHGVSGSGRSQKRISLHFCGSALLGGWR